MDQKFADLFKAKFPLLYRVLFTNWKTSVCGILVVLAGIGRLTKVLDREEFGEVLAVVTGAGFFAAKDGVREEVVAPENVPLAQD